MTTCSRKRRRSPRQAKLEASLAPSPKISGKKRGRPPVPVIVKYHDIILAELAKRRAAGRSSAQLARELAKETYETEDPTPGEEKRVRRWLQSPDRGQLPGLARFHTERFEEMKLVQDIKRRWINLLS